MCLIYFGGKIWLQNKFKVLRFRFHLTILSAFSPDYLVVGMNVFQLGQLYCQAFPAPILRKYLNQKLSFHFLSDSPLECENNYQSGFV